MLFMMQCIFVQIKLGIVQAKTDFTRQLDCRQPGNFKPCQSQQLHLERDTRATRQSAWDTVTLQWRIISCLTKAMRISYPQTLNQHHTKDPKKVKCCPHRNQEGTTKMRNASYMKTFYSARAVRASLCPILAACPY